MATHSETPTRDDCGHTRDDRGHTLRDTNKGWSWPHTQTPTRDDRGHTLIHCGDKTTFAEEHQRFLWLTTNTGLWQYFQGATEKFKLSYTDVRDHIHMHMHMQTHTVYLAMEQLAQQIQRTKKEQHFENKTKQVHTKICEYYLNPYFIFYYILWIAFKTLYFKTVRWSGCLCTTSFVKHLTEGGHKRWPEHIGGLQWL